MFALTQSGLVFWIFALALASWWLKNFFRRGIPLPPSPTKVPIVGNLFNAPKTYQWLQYARWAKDFDSDIIHTETLGTVHVVLNSFEAANELLNRRGAIYSDRPQHLMIAEIMGQNFNLGLIPYGHGWRARRRTFWQEFMPANSHLHEPVEAKNARYLLRLLLKDPDDFLRHIRYTHGASILEVAYGIVPEPIDDPIVALGDRILSHWEDAPIFGAFLVDVIPALRYLPRWMPGAGFQKLGDIARQEIAEFLHLPYSMACKLMSEGKVVPSFVSRALSKLGSRTMSKEEEQTLKDAVAVAYIGGIDTIPSATSSFFVAMFLYPEVQMKAQMELDTYLDRLPELSDRPSLPYVHAVMLEVLRWQPVIPLGVAHATIMEDEYKGFYIPKNSTVSANIWAILNDEDRFPHPREFCPERFLVDGKIDDELVDHVMSTFGFGQRMCPGRFFALDSLWLTVASVLYTFNIMQALDDEGKPIVPDINYQPFFIRHVDPFKCAIEPRSERDKKIVEDSELLQY